jgi:hypothetical protein
MNTNHQPTRTQLAARQAYELDQRRRIERDPRVRAVLEEFPGAEVVDVRLADNV